MTAPHGDAPQPTLTAAQLDRIDEISRTCDDMDVAQWQYAQSDLLDALPDLIALARDGIRWRQFIQEVGPDLEDTTIEDLDYLRRIRDSGTGSEAGYDGE